METENQYLGKEKVSKLLFKFSIPCILALLITSLYNVVDQIFIGHGTAAGLGAVGNAATSIVFPLTLVAVALSGMFGDGTAAFLSICQGRKDTKNAHRAVGGSMLITFVLSLILVALGFTFVIRFLASSVHPARTLSTPGSISSLFSASSQSTCSAIC